MHVVFFGLTGGFPFSLTQIFGPHARVTRLRSEADAEPGGLFGLAPDLIVVDGRDATRDHIKTVRSVRKLCAGTKPILMLAGTADGLRIEDYLYAGADAYMQYPVAAAEFRERVAALMRRLRFLHVDQETKFGDYEFIEAGRIVVVGARSVPLRRTEFRLALYLFRNASRVVKREELTQVAGCRTLQDESRTLDTHLSRIRNALGLNKLQHPLLRSIYGQGYFLALETASQRAESSRLVEA